MKKKIELRKENNHLVLNCTNENCEHYDTDSCPLSALTQLEFSDDSVYCLVSTTETEKPATTEAKTVENEETTEIKKVVRQPIQLNQSKFLKSFKRSVRAQ